MSSCGACSSGCKCGSGCTCSGCTCCKRNPVFAEESITTAQTKILGVAPEKGFEGFEAVEGENGGCKCGSNCTCDPCTCK
ncbi:metallothionein-like protein type 2 [Asparagus officinalis]|uniref:metallothionein-like protein type 2 n=1 Tax=Asparagus officinalis TaxID=4686 RepID=UPI00098E28AB|nr:metallothionein-like protein type 2 [Asparagus officinalis]